MSAEPDYLAQTGDVDSPDAHRAWVVARLEEARAAGCTHGRVSTRDDLRLLLYEGWIVRPEREGEPRWQLTRSITVSTTLEQDLLTGHASREDEESHAACAPNRDDEG